MLAAAFGTNPPQLKGMARNLGPWQLLGIVIHLQRWHLDFLHPAADFTDEVVVVGRITTVLDLHLPAELRGIAQVVTNDDWATTTKRLRQIVGKTVTD